MRHRKSGRKFGRNSTHRNAMFSNMVAALVTHGRIETTEAKAKELRGIAEKTINWSVKVGDLYTKGQKKLSSDERLQVVHAIRMAKRVLKDGDALGKLFNEIGPSYVGRPGGYTRVLKTRNRLGDAAPMAIIELVEGKKAKKAKKKKAMPAEEAAAE